MTTIFPGLVSDVEPLIVNNCDVNSLIQLSGVNKELYALLSNKKHFQDHYKNQYPALFNDNHFTTLRAYHPFNCWKVICQLMDSDRYRSVFPKLAGSFVDEAKSHFLVQKQDEKQRLTEKMKAICGSYYEDPNSPIDKAWKAYKHCSEAIGAIKEKLNPIMKEMWNQVQFASHGDGDAFAAEIFDNPNKFRNITEEEFMNIPEDEREGMSIEFLPQYRIIAELAAHFLSITDSPEFTNLVSQTETFLFEYDALESKRRSLVGELEFIDHEISIFLANPSETYLSTLAFEYQTARRREDLSKEQSQLLDCHNLISQLIEHPQQQTTENLNRIRSLINGMSVEIKTYIWEYLYHRCANNTIEDQWSEKHFQEHLSFLWVAVQDCCRFQGVSGF